MSNNSVRAKVFDGLLAVALSGRSAQDILPGFLSLPDADKRLAFELFYGCLHHYYELQAAVKDRLQKPLKKGDADLRILMILGMYQLSYTRIAEHAALNETVDLCHHLNKSWATKLVNAVLRRYQREQEGTTKDKLSPADKANFPNWLFQQIADDWPEQAKEIYLASHQRAPLTIRINQQQTTTEAFLKALDGSDFEYERQSLHDYALNFNRVGDVTKLPGYADGWFSVQDAAAQFTAAILAPKSGEHILDACAAPGGKTSQILEATSGKVSVVALDNVESRLNVLRENLTRLKLKADIRLGDALEPKEWLRPNEAFDKILLDAPCTATGIIRRHPDINLHRRAKDVRVLNQLQWRLLKTMWGLLKPGGVLVYSTCSILKAENENMIDDFLKQNPEASLTPFTTSKTQETEPGIWQILPGQNNMDGFFYAKLQKQG